ncbi:MAG: hypothetical protein WDA68_02890 [Phycisphaerae bacterium]
MKMKTGQKIEVYLKGTNKLVHGGPCVFHYRGQSGMHAIDRDGNARLFNYKDFDIRPQGISKR